LIAHLNLYSGASAADVQSVKDVLDNAIFRAVDIDKVYDFSYLANLEVGFRFASIVQFLNQQTFFDE
jgi:hypothetical protein